MSNLPDGTYSIQIADDLNKAYLSANGGLDSSIDTCDATMTAPPGAISQDTIIIDSTPPQAATPRVIVADKTAQVSVQASDAGTGIASYTWNFGDGAVESTSAQYGRHTYLTYGTFDGSVTVTDGAGNQTTQPFTITLLPSRTVVGGESPDLKRRAWAGKSELRLPIPPLTHQGCSVAPARGKASTRVQPARLPPICSAVLLSRTVRLHRRNMRRFKRDEASPRWQRNVRLYLRARG